MTTQVGTDESDPRTGTTRARGTQPSSFLNAAQVEQAMSYLHDCWPHQPIVGSAVEAWTDVLERMKPGELKPALARCATSAGRFRPDPYAVLGAAQDARPVPAPKPWVAPVVTEAPRETVEEWFARTRAALGPTRPVRSRWK